MCIQLMFPLLNVSRVNHLLSVVAYALVLSLSEKFFIIRNLDNVNMLNKKTEFISKSCHINKRLLIKVEDDSNG